MADGEEALPNGAPEDPVREESEPVQISFKEFFENTPPGREEVLVKDSLSYQQNFCAAAIQHQTH